MGALLLAIGASACCWLPLLLVGLGAGATGAGAVFESLRPYLMAATVVFLGVAYYVTYRRGAACMADGSCATSGAGRRAKAMLWGITVVAAVSFLFPSWSASRLRDANADEAALGAPAFVIPVEGMTCAACGVKIHEAVMSVPGVRAAKVEESPGRVSIWTDGKVDPAVVVEAVATTGYRPGVPRPGVPPSGRAEAAATMRTTFIEVEGMVQRLGIT